MKLPEPIDSALETKAPLSIYGALIATVLLLPFAALIIAAIPFILPLALPIAAIIWLAPRMPKL